MASDIIHAPAPLPMAPHSLVVPGAVVLRPDQVMMADTPFHFAAEKIDAGEKDSSPYGEVQYKDNTDAECSIFTILFLISIGALPFSIAACSSDSTNTNNNVCYIDPIYGAIGLVSSLLSAGGIASSCDLSTSQDIYSYMTSGYSHKNDNNFLDFKLPPKFVNMINKMFPDRKEDDLVDNGKDTIRFPFKFPKVSLASFKEFLNKRRKSSSKSSEQPHHKGQHHHPQQLQHLQHGEQSQHHHQQHAQPSHQQQQHHGQQHHGQQHHGQQHHGQQHHGQQHHGQQHHHQGQQSHDHQQRPHEHQLHGEAPPADGAKPKKKPFIYTMVDYLKRPFNKLQEQVKTSPKTTQKPVPAPVPGPTNEGLLNHPVSMIKKGFNKMVHSITHMFPGKKLKPQLKQEAINEYELEGLKAFQEAQLKSEGRSGDELAAPSADFKPVDDPTSKCQDDLQLFSDGGCYKKLGKASCPEGQTLIVDSKTDTGVCVRLDSV